MDQDTTIAVLELQREELLLDLQSRRGQYPGGEKTDFEIWAELQASELETLITTLKDRRMSERIAGGDEVESRQGPSGEAYDTEPAQAAAQESISDDGSMLLDYDHHEAVIKYVLPGIFPETDDDDNLLSVKEEPGFALRQCSACIAMHPEPQTYVSVCGHVYCDECLTRLFEDALKDESLFPPRCCREEMPLQAVSGILGVELTHQVQLKLIEHQTGDKTYCAIPTCSTFILPDDIIGTRGFCTSCDAATCISCKRLYHHGGCETIMENEVVQLAEQQGWRRCYHCHSFVELTYGCYHMTCRCRAEFCYLCGARWKTCACVHWDNARLVARAADVVARAPLAAGVNRQQAIAQEAQHLRERHECAHPSPWRRLWPVNPQCEICHRVFPRTILECRQCRLQACMRCRRNRL